MKMTSAKLLRPAVRTSVTFVFCVECEGGTFAPIITARDEPAAWVKLTREYALCGVRSITAELQDD
jgi:hypothetical protein